MTPTGGSHGKPHRTTRLLSHARRRGGRGADRRACAAGARPSAHRRTVAGVTGRATRNIEALRAGLRDLGYVEDRNVTLALRFAGGVPARLPELAAELVALKPDVILAGSIGGILAARNATRAIPLIMMVISEDPV